MNSNNKYNFGNESENKLNQNNNQLQGTDYKNLNGQNLNQMNTNNSQQPSPLEEFLKEVNSKNVKQQNIDPNDPSNFKQKDIKEKKPASRLTFLIVGGICVLGLAIMPIISFMGNNNTAKDSDSDVIKLGVIEEITEVDERFVLKSDAYNLRVPDFFTQEEVLENGVRFTDASNTYKMIYQQSIELTQEEFDMFTKNNVNFYGYILNNTYEELGIKDLNNYTKLQEFSNEKYSLYPIAFKEESLTKYVVYNTYTKDGKFYLAYAYIELPNDKNSYLTQNETEVEKHVGFLTKIFSEFTR